MTTEIERVKTELSAARREKAKAHTQLQQAIKEHNKAQIALNAVAAENQLLKTERAHLQDMRTRMFYGEKLKTAEVVGLFADIAKDFLTDPAGTIKAIKIAASQRR